MKIIGKTRIKNNSYYICKCPYCDSIINIRFDHYKERKRDDCGCQNHLEARDGKHSKLYDVHQAMKQRCLNKNCYCYNRYGGRGITVCYDWLDYKKFKEWAISHGYQENLDLDRIDNNGNYEPNNCRFIEHKKNCNNRENSFFTIEQLEIIEKSGYCRRSIKRRMKKHNISFEKAIKIPKNIKKVDEYIC